MQKRILFISCQYHLFTDMDCGASMRSTMFVRALAEIGNVDIVSFANQEVLPDVDNCKVVYQKWHPFAQYPTAGSFGKFKNLMHQILKPGNPYFYYHLDTYKMSVVDDIIKKGKYDYIACRYIGEATICGLLKYSHKLILDVDDNLVAAAKRDLSNRRFRNKVQKFIAYKRTSFLGVMSKNVLQKIKYSFFSNISEPPYTKSVFLPNVTSIGSISQLPEAYIPHKLLVVGWLDFHPNRCGVEHFVYNVFPKVRDIIKDVELNIVGRCNDVDFITRLKCEPGVNVLGFVKDIKVEYEKTGIVIVPIYQGAGTSVKFAEALMTNRPIVTTPMGVRGFEHLCKDGRDYLLANDDNEFANAIVRILSSANFGKTIAESAFKVGNAHFSTNSFINIVKETIK